MLALALASTHVAWTARLSAPVGTPAVADGRIYVASGAKHTRLHALDATSGRREWSAIGGLGTLYAPLADTGLLLRLSNADVLRRHDPGTGRVFWRRNSLFAEGFLAQPLLANGRVFELSDSLVAVDARTGTQLWRANDDCFRCRVAADATRVYAAGKQGMRAFDAATGKVLWQTRGFAGLDTVSSPVLANGIVAVVESSLQGKTWSFYLEAFRAGDGHALWHAKLTSTTAGFDPFAAPASDGRLVLFPATDGTLYALDLATGTLRWQVPVGATDSIPAIANGTVWIVDGGNHLLALSETTGAKVWSGPPTKGQANGPTASPVLDGGLVLVGTGAGNLIAYAQH